MPANIVVGTQWGDEGKGKIIDIMASRADVVVRATGAFHNHISITAPVYANGFSLL